MKTKLSKLFLVLILALSLISCTDKEDGAGNPVSDIYWNLMCMPGSEVCPDSMKTPVP